MGWNLVAGRQHGIISRQQLRAAGADDRSITRLVDRQELWPQLEGVFLVRGAPLTYAARLWVAVLSTEGVVAFDSASYVWAMTTKRPASVHICVPNPARSRTADWITLHRVDVSEWGRTVRAGLPITTRSWTTLDLVGAAVTDSAGSLILDRAIQQGWVTADDVERRLRLLRGRHGNGRLRRFQSQLTDRAAAESERVLHRILRRHRVTGWRANARIRIGPGEWVEGDVVFEEHRLVVEVDGWAVHSRADRFRRDRQKQNALVSLGWTVIRFTWFDLVDRPGYVLATVSANLSAQMDAG